MPDVHYFILILLHLFAAFIFVGTVFFEVLMLEGIRKHVPKEAMRTIELAIGNRARRFMPIVIIVLYAAGIGLAWHYRALLAHPFSNSFGLLLSLKILLAISVLIHFISAITLSAKKRLRGVHFKYIHLSVFLHMLGIIFLAKAMFFLH